MDNNGDGYTSDVIEGILYVANNNTDVINCLRVVVQPSNGRQLHMPQACPVVVMAAVELGGSSLTILQLTQLTME